MNEGKWKKRETTFVDFLFSVKDNSLSATCKRIGKLEGTYERHFKGVFAVESE